MVFETAVFTHTEFLGGFDNLLNTRRINEPLYQKIRDEVHRSDIIMRCEDFIVSRTLAKGYSIEYSEPGRKFKLSDTFINTVLNRQWMPELDKALRFGLRYGMYVTQYLELPEADDGELTYRLYVLDPDDYVIRFRKSADGRREYAAFHRSQNLVDKPVENSRVMVFFDCDSDGFINSPVQKALEQIIQLREYWERNTVVDHKNAFPLQQFYIDSKEQKLIPNKMPDSAFTPFEDTFGMQESDRDAQQYAGMHTAEKTSRFMDKLMSQRRNVEEQVQSYGVGERYDPLNRRFMYVAKEDPGLPYSILPSGLRAESGGSKPVFNPHFKDLIGDLVHRITGDMGVPSEFVYDTGRKFSSDFELTQSVINSTVEFWQNKLEQHIVVFYLDLFYRDIEDHVENVFKTADQLLNLNAKNNPDAKLSSSLPPLARKLIERNITVTVQFASNPVLQASDVEWLRTNRVITRETFQKLALDTYGLPHSDRATDEELAEEDLRDAKRQKMMQDIMQPSEPQAAAADSRPKSAGAKAADAKAKGPAKGSGKAVQSGGKRKTPDS